MESKLLALTSSILLILAFTNQFPTVVGHGRLIRPPSRSSVWRLPEFRGGNPPTNYNDNQLFCGGIHQEDNPGTNCGVCGDPISEDTPRSNEIGGRYYAAILTANYSSGQIIEVEAEITAAHRGYMQFRLCSDASTETQSCFNRHLLTQENSKGTQIPVSTPGVYRVTLKLPHGVRCDHCILQWNYRAGNNWGYCNDGTSGLGCGPQETFRGCADIQIV